MCRINVLATWHFLILFILLMNVSGYAYTLYWDIPLHNRLEIVKTADVNVYVNSKFQKQYHERNIIDLTCYKKQGNQSLIKGYFSIYQKDWQAPVFAFIKKSPADFVIEKNGNYIVGQKYHLPNLRNIPFFPDTDLKVGDSWKAKGEMIINEFSRPFKFIFDITYTLHKVRKATGGLIAEIRYSYSINRDFKGSFPKDFPIKIVGKNNGIIEWDLTQNCQIWGQDGYQVLFGFKNGRYFTTLEFRMLLTTRNKLYKPVSKNQKELAKKKLQKEMPKDIKVDTEKRGLVLRLGDVLFDFDSFTLHNSSKSQLDKVCNIIRDRYSSREIIIEGHTDSIGKDAYNKALSEKRAQHVAELLRKHLTHDKISYKGYGSEQPIAENNTKKGRQKNRRVEIIIKLN